MNLTNKNKDLTVMGYYTVIAKSDRNGHTKTFKGVKAKSVWTAVEAIEGRLCKSNKWSYEVYLSKRRPRRYKHSKHTNKLRRPWAVLAKNAKRQHFNVLNAWSNLHYARLTYMAWVDDTPPVFQVKSVLDNLFGPYTEALLTGDESKLPVLPQDNPLLDALCKNLEENPEPVTLNSDSSGEY